MTNILGVILCGGESKRMGTDKGLMPVKETIRAKFMAEKLSVLNIPVIFSINKNQFQHYSRYILPGDLVSDANEMKGPARGLLTVHNKFPTKNMLLLACDMLEMDAGTVNHLLHIYSSENNYDFYVYQDNEYAQPFCGIYTAKGINKLKGLLSAKSFTNISMQYILNTGNTKRVEIRNRQAFENFNFK